MRKRSKWSKKIISVFVMLCMCFTMTSTVFAESDMSVSADKELDQKVKEAQKYAYMDIDKVSPDMKEKVLEARDTIIYSKDWVADGFEGYVEHADGTTEELPLFSELFPDWDLPCADIEEDIPSNKSELNSTVSKKFMAYLNNPSESEQSSPFCHVNFSGLYLETHVSELLYSANCNVGYSDERTGKSIAYKRNMPVGDNFSLAKTAMKTFPCSVRASTYSNPGRGLFTVIHREIPEIA